MTKRGTIFLMIVLLMVLLMSVSQVFAGSPDTGLFDADDKTAQAEEEAGDDDDGDSPGKKEEKMAEQEAKKTEKAEDREEMKADKKTGKKVNVRGTVDTVDEGSISVLTKDGEVVVIVLTDDTRIKIPGGKDTGEGMIQVGDQVTARCYPLEDDGLEALSVHVIPGKPEKVHRVGEVTEYTEGVSLTILTKHGDTTTFTIGEEFKIIPEERLELLGIGAHVTVISSRDHTGEGPVAKGVVVHPAEAEETEDPGEGD